jgi:hypothetical protein
MRSSIWIRGLMMGSELTRTGLLRMILRSLNGSLKTISQLERDPPIIELAHVQIQNGFMETDLIPLEKELFQLLSMINLYRAKFWKLERSIKQSFIKLLKVRKYLPSSSPEVDSLKSALPDAIIKDDDRIWVYSFDHYIGPISSKVGRKREDAPKGSEVFETISRSHDRETKEIEKIANDILPQVHILKAKVHSLLKDPDRDWNEIHIKRPKITSVKRPIQKVIVVRRPLPLPKKGKMPRKKVLKKPDFEMIGPEVRK